MNLQQHTVPALLLVSALLVGCGDPPESDEAEPVAEVTTEVAAVTDLPIRVTGYGVVEFDPTGQRILTSEIEASILELKVLPGDSVRKGDIVVRLAPSTNAGTELATTRRDAGAARAAAERTKRLREDGLASDADVEVSEVAARDLEALAASLESRAGSIAAIASPIDGIVDAVLVEPGVIVAPGTMLARIASPGSIQARIGVEVEDVGELSIGDAVEIDGHDSSDTHVDTRIRMIDLRVDAATRMTSIYVVIPPGSGFLAGQAVRAKLTTDIREDVVAVPRQSVFADELGHYVFVAVDGKAELRRVESGVTEANQTEIVSGVSAGDVVIVEGAAILRNGMNVRTPVSAPATAQ
jgi:membrane fusion protein (multidrug efflux system)